MSRTAKIGAAVAAGLALLAGSGAAACKFALHCGLHGFDTDEGGPGDVPPIAAGSAMLREGWTERAVVAGLDFPTDFAFLPSGDVLVSEKNGLVRLAEPGSDSVRTVLDLRSRVSTSDIRGLVTLTVDPAFPRSPYVYVIYTAAVEEEMAPTTSHVSRFTWRDSSLDPASERILVTVPVEDAHAGGQIDFASDGTLFLSTGDGVNSNERPKSLTAQDVDTLRGKVLRIAPDGKGLRGNPFWNGDPDAARSKVWAYGFRNPFRLTLLPGSGTPVVADVGFLAQDEVSVVTKGSNNGWPCYEGTARGPSGYPRTSTCRMLYRKGSSARNAPVVTFRHSDTASITGGTFWRTNALDSPTGLVYVFADFAYGWLRYLEVEGGKLGTTAHELGGRLPGPVALHVGPDNAVYYLSAPTGELRGLEHRP